MRKICERFAPMAAEQEVHLKVNIPDEDIEMQYAVDSVEKIISNLLSNAMKYGQGLTPEQATAELERIKGEQQTNAIDITKLYGMG